MVDYEKIRRNAAKLGRDAYYSEHGSMLSWKQFKVATDAAIDFYNAALTDISEELKLTPPRDTAEPVPEPAPEPPADAVRLASVWSVVEKYRARHNGPVNSDCEVCRFIAELNSALIASLPGSTPAKDRPERTREGRIDLHEYCGASGARWAEQFVMTAHAVYGITLDEGWVIDWFASAIEAATTHRLDNQNRSIVEHVKATVAGASDYVVDVDTLLDAWANQYRQLRQYYGVDRETSTDERLKEITNCLAATDRIVAALVEDVERISGVVSRGSGVIYTSGGVGFVGGVGGVGGAVSRGSAAVGADTLKDNGGPAFPEAFYKTTQSSVPDYRNGMTLRDWFAGQAIGLWDLTRYSAENGEVAYGIAKLAYGIADAMIKERSE